MCKQYLVTVLQYTINSLLIKVCIYVKKKKKVKTGKDKILEVEGAWSSEIMALVTVH